MDFCLIFKFFFIRRFNIGDGRYPAWAILFSTTFFYFEFPF